jgi:hypothetical protein
VLDGLLPREDAAVNEELYGKGIKSEVSFLHIQRLRQTARQARLHSRQGGARHHGDDRVAADARGMRMRERLGRCCSPIYVVYANEDT